MENSTGVSLVRRSQGMTEAQDVLRKSGEQKRHIKEQKQRFVNLRAQVEAQRARQVHLANPVSTNTSTILPRSWVMFR